MDKQPNETAKPGDPADPKGMTPEPSSPLERLWRAITKKCDRFEDGPTRVAIAMAVVAALSALTAYRATEEERKSAICDRQLGQAQTYELVQRQRYLDSQIEHTRWSDRAKLATSFSDTLLQNATSFRLSHPGLRGGAPGLLDVEAQLEHAVLRGIEPVREFTDPRLPGRDDDDLEGRLRARAEQDVKDLGIAKRCAVHDNFWTAAAAPSTVATAAPTTVAAEPPATADIASEDYLDQLRGDVTSLHSNAVEDALALLAFVGVLVLFTLSQVFDNRTRRGLEIFAVLTVPVSLFFAVTRSDEWMMRLLLVANTLIGLFVLTWLVWQLVALHRSEAVRTDAAKPPPGAHTAEPVSKHKSRLARYFDELAAPSSPRGRSPAGNRLRRVIRRMEVDIGVVLVSLACVAALAAYDYAAHVTRTGTILVVVLLPTIAFIIAAWRTVDGMRHVHDTQAPAQNRVDVSKGAFAYAGAAVATLGVFVVATPSVALIVEHRGVEWLHAIGWGGAVLATVLASLLLGIEFSVRSRAAALDVARGHSFGKVMPDFVASETTKRTPPRGANDVHHNAETLAAASDPSAAKFTRLMTVDHAFGRLVVLLVAITALWSAFITYMYTREGGQANEFAAKAASAQLDLMRSSSLRTVLSYRTIERLVMLREARLRTVVARQLRADAAAAGPRENVAIWNHEARRWQLAWETVGNIILRDDQGDARSAAIVDRVRDPNGLNDDPSFLAKLFVESTVRTAAERLALWDAYNDADTASEIRADLLLAGAAFFTISLYLFGQSLGLKRFDYASVVLTATGAALLLVGIGFAASGFLQPVPDVERIVTVPETCRTGDDPRQRTTASAAAAICYARAELLAALPQNPDYYRRAQKAYAAAMRDDMRPSFTLAHYRALLAKARFETPQRTEPIALAGDELQKIIDGEVQVIEDLQARERAVPASLRETLGFHQYLRAIKQEDPALLDRAVENLSAGVVDEPQARFRLAVALLATHRSDESAKAYKSALETPSQDMVAQREVQIAAINDLELLRNVCPPWWRENGAALERAPECRLLKIVDAQKAAILKALWKTDQSAAITAPRGELHASATPGGIDWHFHLAYPAPADLPLIMVVSRNDKEAPDNWYVVPSASGPIRPTETTHREGPDLIGFRDALQDGGACLASGATYRIQIWLGMHVLAEADKVVPETLPPFGSVTVHAQDVTMCVPGGKDGWARSRLHPDHLEASYRVRKGVAGVDLFAFVLPRDASTDARNQFRKKALGDAMQRRTGNDLGSRALHAMNEPCLPGRGIPQSTRITWTFQGYDVLAQTWSSPQDGLFHVALAWYTGPSDVGVACGVLASLMPIDLDVDTPTSGGEAGKSNATAHSRLDAESAP